MAFLRVERFDQTCVAWMAGDRANAIGEGAVREFDLLLASTRTDPETRSIVIASEHPRVFSSGFDVREVFAFDRDRMRGFFSEFAALLAAIRRFPKPVAAAVGGHALAAGALIAAACDARVFAPEASFSIRAVDLGVVLPRALVEMIDAAAPSLSRRLLLGGESIGAAEALDCGLAHAVADDPVAAAQVLAAHYASKPPGAFAGLKEVFARDASTSAAELDPFLDRWFSAEAEEARERLVESLSVGRDTDSTEP